MKSAGIAALISAAGYSSRMGRCKPLLRVNGTSMVELAVNCFSGAGIHDVTVILGHDADMIGPVVRELGVKWIVNEQYDEGMLSSVLSGIRCLDPEVGAFFILPCDIPLICSGTVRCEKPICRGK